MVSLIKEFIQLNKLNKGRNKLKIFRVSMNSLLRSVQEVLLCQIMDTLKNIKILKIKTPIDLRLRMLPKTIT